MNDLRSTPATCIDSIASFGEVQDRLAILLEGAIGREVVTADRHVGILVNWTGERATVFLDGNLIHYGPLDVVPADSDLALLVKHRPLNMPK